MNINSHDDPYDSIMDDDYAQDYYYMQKMFTDKMFKFILENYPVEQYKTILQVGANNRTSLATNLLNKNYCVSVMDINSIPKNFNKEINIINENIEPETDISSYDLAIAMHACQGGEYTISSGFKSKTDIVVAPCSRPICLNSERINNITNLNDWLKVISLLYPKLKEEPFWLSSPLLYTNHLTKSRQNKRF